MSGISKKSPSFILSLYRNLSLTSSSVVSIVFILLIGTGCKTCADDSFMHEAKAVVEDFYGRYNATTAVDLVFVLDRSESVTRSGWYSIIKFVKNILDPFSVDQDHVRVAVITFSSAAVTEFNGLEDDATADDATRCSVYRQLRNLFGDAKLHGSAATSAALSEARKVLLNTREVAKKAVLLITDSFPNVGVHPRKMSLQIQTLSWGLNRSSAIVGPQVEVYAFGIASADKEFLESVASDLPKHFSHFPNFSAFDEFTDSIRTGNNIEDHWIDAEVSNCGQNCGHQNSKCMCGVTTGLFSCACKPGYELDGSVCKACQQGYYKPGYVPGHCRPCPQNSTTSVDGATNSSSCRPLPGHQICPELPKFENGYKFLVSGNKMEEEIENTGLDCKDVRDGNTCHYECKTGYRLINGTKARKCNALGKWEGITPHCQIVDCEIIPESWANASNISLTYAGNTTYGSAVFASCWSGLVAFGPTVWTCGENALWKGKSNFQCKEVHCGALIPVRYANMVPADCGTVKKPIGYQCQMICRKGFSQTGPSNFTCSFEGGTFWKPHVEEEDRSECHDVEEPTITCPPNITYEIWNWENCSVIDYHRDRPTYQDNSGSVRYRIINEPENGTFCEGHSVLTYEAFDQAGNKKSCDRQIEVVAKDFETFHCPNDIVMTVNSSSRSQRVAWPDPIFLARNGDVLPFNCTGSKNGDDFTLGTRNVTCFPKAFPKSPCIFRITITNPPCDLPFADRKPFHGNVSCVDVVAVAKKCSVECQEGFEFIADTSQSIFCSWDGTWNLKTIWPQCHRSRRPNLAQSVNRLVVTFDGSVCVQKRALIYDGFIKKAGVVLRKYESDTCKSHCKIYFHLVDLTCPEGRSRYKRSDVPLNNLTSASDSVNSTIHTATLAGNFTLTFVIWAELNVTIQSIVTKSRQSDMTKALDGINSDIHNSIAKGEFVWYANDLLVTAISLDPPDIEFPNLNCADDEAKQIEEDAATCFTCSVGTFYHIGSCVPCPLGSYKDFEGRKSCKPCKGDQNTTSVGARDASECRDPCTAGHSSLTGYEPCTACRVGEYQSEMKSNSCLSCPVNQTTSSTESTSIDDCYEPVNCSVFNSTCEPNGICIRRQGDDIQCLCKAGFTGLWCETNINECDHSLCQNNGTCVDGIAAYACNCSSSFTGERCEIEVDECTSFPCKNGGSCVDNFILYSCVCPQGFTGTYCEIDIDECNPNPCKNFGTCKDGIQSFVCSCVDEYTGHICDRLKDICASMSCSNGGKCNRSRKACSCLKGYTGKHCESEIDSCASDPCQNNGTCINGVGSFHCRCPSGFIGDTCSQGVSPDFDLIFPKASTANFVKLRLKLGASSLLQQVTVCTWMRSSDIHNSGTIWSYAAENNWLSADTANVLTASDYGNLKIFVNGKPAAMNLALNDGNWHHLCFTWRRDGDWMFYLNGTRRQSGQNLAEGTYIESNGMLILGQKQDSFGGRFSSRESFVGELTQFSIFSEVLPDGVIAAMASVESGKCKLTHQGTIVSWTDVLDDAVHGNVTIRNASWCMDVNECRSVHLNNCTSSTRCEDTLGSYTCVKCDGTSDCFEQEVSPTECTADRCLNGATCKTNVGGYYCDCKPGFLGRHCEKEVPRLECEKNPCRNGGTCNSSVSECFCATPWTGRFCQVTSLVKCEAHPCFNNGTCVDREQGYNCTCPPLNLTLGNDCEILSACASSPCQSGATCVTESVTGYRCECQPGYFGENCEIPDTCKNVKCKNHGLCQSLGGGFKCKCTPDYKGNYCEVHRRTGVTVYNVQVRLEEQFDTTLPYNETFKTRFINEIHNIYRLHLNDDQLFINIKTIRGFSAGSVLVDFDLTHTYYLDDDKNNGLEAMRKILEDRLKTGRLGPYKATSKDFVFTEVSESSNATLYISVIVITIIVAALILTLVYLYIRRNRMARAKNKSLTPLRVSNPMYQGNFSLSSQDQSTVQDGVYCDPVELLPYSTSEDSDRDSDLGGDGQLKKKTKNWLLRQSIPLPSKPDEALASGPCGPSPSELLNRASPPPPYSADAHAPIPPPREILKHPMPPKIQHNYANQPQVAAADSCYFMPLSDEEAELLTGPKSDESISENPAFEPESAYLIPCQPVVTWDATKDAEMTYLAPIIDGEAEDVGGAAAATNGIKLGNGSDVTYAIRSISSESSEGNNEAPLLLK